MDLWTSTECPALLCQKKIWILQWSFGTDHELIPSWQYTPDHSHLQIRCIISSLVQRNLMHSNSAWYYIDSVSLSAFWYAEVDSSNSAGWLGTRAHRIFGSWPMRGQLLKGMCGLASSIMIYKFDESDLFITLFGFEKHVQSQIECCWIDRSRSCTPEIYLYFNQF